jgi:hypothetical protein
MPGRHNVTPFRFRPKSESVRETGEFGQLQQETAMQSGSREVEPFPREAEKWRRGEAGIGLAHQADSSGRRKEGRGGSQSLERGPQTSSGYLDDFAVDPFFKDAARLPSRRYASKAAASVTGRNRSWRSSGNGRSNCEESRPKAPGGGMPREERPGELLACLMTSFRVATAVPGGSVAASREGFTR